MTPWDIEDPRAWSGVVKPMAAALAQRCELIPVSTRAVGDSIVDRALARLLDRRWGKNYLVGQAIATSLKRGRALDKRLAEISPDAVIAVAASQDIAFSRTQVPIVQVSDTTLAAISNYYELFSNVQPISRWQARIVASRSARRAAHTLAATQWAKEALIRDDGIPEERITVAPFGPAITPSGHDGDCPTEGPLKLLAVTSDWHRKGGDRVLEVFRTLRGRGIPVELTIAGRTPPLPPGVHGAGFVSRDEMAELYATHDVLLELARSNAAGVTLTDAAGFGLSALATRTGGVESIVLDGATGVLITNDDASVVQQAVSALEGGRDRFAPMARQACSWSAERLNWQVWAQDALAVASRCVAEDGQQHAGGGRG